MGKVGMNLHYCVELMFVMVLGIACLSSTIMQSSAQNPVDEQLPPCWDKITKCIFDHKNRSSTDPEFNATSPSFNLTEFACCSLMQQAVQNERQCFCYVDTLIQRQPSLAYNLTLTLGACSIADSVSALNTLCAAALAPASDSVPSESRGVSKTVIAVVVPSAILLIMVIAIGVALYCRKAKKVPDIPKIQSGDVLPNELSHPSKSPAVHAATGLADDETITVESLLYDWEVLKAATNNFADDHKIGQGGFGVVYKGTLAYGEEIAVKRLSNSSWQGDKEFKNEVAIVAKLQHKNLVKLVGFCLTRDEKLLVYEYVPNKSLDYFLFDPDKQRQLDWSRRHNIIKGIARGMLYIHEDSPVRIIHRDLKAANVLLDSEMNPRITDFGMARIFDIEQTNCNTSRVIGTYGYMAPEYLIHGHFSIKSDVYSFGVLVLEIVSGKRISARDYESGSGENLLSYAWRCWRDSRLIQFMDPTLRDSYSKDEISRCIHLGLLCVQGEMERRPTMATVTLILNTNFAVSDLPLPQPPAFMYKGSTDQSTTTRTSTTSMPWSQSETTSDANHI